MHPRALPAPAAELLPGGATRRRAWPAYRGRCHLRARTRSAARTPRMWSARSRAARCRGTRMRTPRPGHSATDHLTIATTVSLSARPRRSADVRVNSRRDLLSADADDDLHHHVGERVTDLTVPASWLRARSSMALTSRSGAHRRRASADL